jgi:hypothetical protein
MQTNVMQWYVFQFENSYFINRLLRNPAMENNPVMAKMSKR